MNYESRGRRCKQGYNRDCKEGCPFVRFSFGIFHLRRKGLCSNGLCAFPDPSYSISAVVADKRIVCYFPSAIRTVHHVSIRRAHACSPRSMSSSSTCVLRTRISQGCLNLYTPKTTGQDVRGKAATLLLRIEQRQTAGICGVKDR